MLLIAWYVQTACMRPALYGGVAVFNRCHAWLKVPPATVYAARFPDQMIIQQLTDAFAASTLLHYYKRTLVGIMDARA